MKEQHESSSTFSILYALLIIGRFACVLLPGYIHPDEFFQGGQELFFGNIRTWEWQEAARSIVPPQFMTLLPVYLSGWEQPTARLVWLAPRLWMTFCSLIVDAVCWELGRNKRSLLFLASAWPTLLFLTRPWSNSLETIAIALLLLCSRSEQKGWQQSVLMGSIAAIGFWTRFTFAFFAFPIYLTHLFSGPSFVRAFLGLAIGFLVTACYFIYSDVVYFHGKFDLEHVPSTITPLNIFIYNLDVSKLAQHGLHFQGMHLLVNMPMLFGVMGLWFYWDCVFGAVSSSTIRLYRWTILSGVFLLSCSPHQEPRFLLPCILPLSILSSRIPISAFVISLLIGSNLLLALFWGLLHQGQVIPSLLAIQMLGNVPVVYWRTYMPPTFLAQKCNIRLHECTNVDIIDMKGSSPTSMMLSLHNHLDGCSSNMAIQLVTPTLYSSNGMEFSSSGCYLPPYDCSLLQSHWPHVSTEDMPPWRGSFASVLDDFQLGVYMVKCPSTPQL